MDLTLLALARELNREEGVASRGIEFTPQGDLWVEMERRGVLQRVGWMASDGPAPDDDPVRLFDMPLRIENAPGRRRQSEAARSLKTALDRIWLRGGGSWLDRRNREISAVSRSVDGLLSLFPWIDSGRPFWTNWRVSEVRAIRDVEGIRFEFTIVDPRSTSFRLVLDPGGRPRERERILAVTAIGLLLESTSRAGSAAVDRGADRPRRAFAFLMSRGSHPGMGWADPSPPPPAGPGSDASQEGGDLLEYCMRSWAQWGGKTSAFFGTWGDADFLSIGAILRSDRRILFHGSRECSNCSTILTNRFQTGPLPWAPTRVGYDFGSFAVTDLDDATTVFGGEKRLEQALAGFRASGGAEREVLVHTNCEYEMMGDDATGVCARSGQNGCRALCLEQPVPGFRSGRGDGWWSRHVLGPALSGGGPGTGISLIGLGHPWERQMREIETLLSLVGIELHSALIPSPEFGERNGTGRPLLAVIRPWAPVLQAAGEAIHIAGVPVLDIEAPYGFQGTLHWVRRICIALGVDGVEERLRRIALPFARAWDELRGRASELTAAFVSDLGAAEQILSPSFFFGFNPLAFMEEAGMGVRLLESRTPAARVRTKRNGTWTEVEIRRPESAPGCALLLHQYPSDLVYCDVAYGDTVKEYGIPSFGIRDFEMGLAGAVRTLRRLVSIAGMKLRPLRSETGELHPWI